MIGTAPITPAAAIGPHSIWILPISVLTPTVIVCELGVDVNDRANRNSLYVTITLKIAVATMLGAASGTTIRRSADSGVSPSTSAASSISGGISPMYLSIIHTTRLTLSPA